MFGEQVKHVIEKSNSSMDHRPACAIDVQLDQDLRFFRAALHPGATLFHAEHQYMSRRGNKTQNGASIIR
jgi:hypothetical protein